MFYYTGAVWRLRPHLILGAEIKIGVWRSQTRFDSLRWVGGARQGAAILQTVLSGATDPI